MFIYHRKYFRCILKLTTTTVVFIALSLVSAKLVRAQSASAIRPRMLIGEHDPLTGFAVLRARYAAGARPPEAIDGWALTYLLTNDESYAKKAVAEMERTHPPEQVGSRTYPEYVKW